MGKYMNKLPIVVNCCYCCFLRSGTVSIAIVSFLCGLILVPNVIYAQGIFDIGMHSENSVLETNMQMMLGYASLMLCISSVSLFLGAMINSTKLIECYEWSAVAYCLITDMIYFVISVHCASKQPNCGVASSFLILLIVINILVTGYFVIVVNSLRMSILYLANECNLDL